MKWAVVCTATIESHSACSCKVVFFRPDSLDSLLGHDIAGCKKDLAVRRGVRALRGYTELALRD